MIPIEIICNRYIHIRYCQGCYIRKSSKVKNCKATIRGANNTIEDELAGCTVNNVGAMSIKQFKTTNMNHNIKHEKG